MRFTAVIAPGLLHALGLREDRESELRSLFQIALGLDTYPDHREQSIQVKLIEQGSFDIGMELDERGAEIVKDILYETLLIFFDPEFDSDIDVEINDEL